MRMGDAGRPWPYHGAETSASLTQVQLGFYSNHRPKLAYWLRKLPILCAGIDMVPARSSAWAGRCACVLAHPFPRQRYARGTLTMLRLISSCLNMVFLAAGAGRCSQAEGGEGTSLAAASLKDPPPNNYMSSASGISLLLFVFGAL